MVVLTIVTQKNGETLFFDEPIPQVHFMKLISCSLYNSWDTLKNVGTFSIIQQDKSISVSKLHPGHYTLEAIAKELRETVKKYIYEISTETYSPLCQLLITNHGESPLRIDRDLANFLGIGRELKTKKIIVKQIKRPMSYFIHCNLIDRNLNFVHNKKSDLMAKIDVKGKPYEKVRYDASPQQPIRDCSTSSHVNSITISIRDKDGELFDLICHLNSNWS